MNPIKIYGSNYDIPIFDFPTIETVEALPDVVLSTIPVRVINGEPAFSIERVEYIGGSKRNYKDITLVFKLETLQINFPDDLTDMNDLYYVDVFSKNYLYLDLNGYKVNPTGLDSTSTVKVDLSSYQINHSEGYKVIQFELEQR